MEDPCRCATLRFVAPGGAPGHRCCRRTISGAGRGSPPVCSRWRGAGHPSACAEAIVCDNHSAHAVDGTNERSMPVDRCDTETGMALSQGTCTEDSVTSCGRGQRGGFATMGEPGTGAGGRSATMDVGRTQRGGFSATCGTTEARKTCGRGMLIRGVEIALLAGLHAGQQGTQCG
jgi:hypothetical protein